MERELRRRRIALMTLGMGVIAFGVWSVLKAFLYLWVDPVMLDYSDVPPEAIGLFKLIVYTIIGVLMLIDLGLRLYVGRAARLEGMGKKRGRAYIIVAALLLAGSALSWLYMLFGHMDARMENQSELDYYLSIFVDFTSVGILVELLYTALRVRKLEKRLEG